MIWGYLIVWAGYMLVFISIAEMTSMYVGEVKVPWSLFTDVLWKGLQPLEVNIIGYLNLLLVVGRDLSAI
jgi:hypothetical protein